MKNNTHTDNADITFWWRHIKQCSWQLSADFVGSSDRALKSFWERVFLQRLQLTFLHSKPVTNYKRDILVHQQVNLFPRIWHPSGLVGPKTVDKMLWAHYSVSVLYFRFNSPAEKNSHLKVELIMKNIPVHVPGSWKIYLFMNILNISRITHVNIILQTFKVGCGIFVIYFSDLQSYCVLLSDACTLNYGSASMCTVGVQSST